MRAVKTLGSTGHQHGSGGELYTGDLANEDCWMKADPAECTLWGKIRRLVCKAGKIQGLGGPSSGDCMMLWRLLISNRTGGVVAGETMRYDGSAFELDWLSVDRGVHNNQHRWEPSLAETKAGCDSLQGGKGWRPVPGIAAAPVWKTDARDLAPNTQNESECMEPAFRPGHKCYIFPDLATGASLSFSLSALN